MDSGKNCSVPSGLSIETLFQKNQDKWINSNTISFPPIHCALVPQTPSPLYSLCFFILLGSFCCICTFPFYWTVCNTEPPIWKTILDQAWGPMRPIKPSVPSSCYLSPICCQTSQSDSNSTHFFVVSMTTSILSLTLLYSYSLRHNKYSMKKKSLDSSEHTSHESKDNTYELEQMTHMHRTLGRKAGARAKAERWTQ